MNIPSIESLLAELDKVKAERDKALQYWKIAEGRCDALIAERDAALAENAAYYQLAKKEVWAIAESALREAKEAFEVIQGQEHANGSILSLGDCVDIADDAIATINKVLL